MTARRRHRASRLAAAMASLLAAWAMAACDSDDGAQSAGGRGHGSAAIGRAMTETIPAQIDPRPQTFISSDVLSPVTNAWRTASRTQLTEVDAGALATDRSTGAFAIFRHDFVSARQHISLVEVEGSGPVRITTAPLGRGVEESAQREGELEFIGADGVHGTLDLSDDSVTMIDR
jgi:hypothetical protein